MYKYGAISEYAEKIRSGEIVAPTDVLKAYDKAIALLDSGQSIFDEKKARRAVKFIEGFCRHSAGRNDLITLELWQKATVYVIHGVYTLDGVRQFREVYIKIARKNGKTTFVAALIAYENYIGGEYGAEIYCIAPKLDQADIVYNAFYQMVLTEPEFAQLSRKRQRDIYTACLNNSVKRLAFNSKKSDGFNPQLSVCDEIEAWEGAKGKKQYEVMKSAMVNRKQPMIISMGTAGYGENGIDDELMLRAKKWLKGGEETAFFPLLYVIEDRSKWDDMEELKKSNPNLGVSVRPEALLEEIKIAKESSSARAEFLTKHCNLKQNATLAWLEYDDVEKISDDDYSLDDFRGCYGFGGYDLSQTTDLTAAAIGIEKNDVIYYFVQFFLPKGKLQEAMERDNLPYDIYVQQGILMLSGEKFVDYHDVLKWYISLVEKYEIIPLVTGYDRYSAQYLNQEMNGYGFKTDDVYQGTNLSPLMYEMEGRIKARSIRIGKNDLLKIHLLDTAVQMQAGTNKIKPVKIEQRKHIDGAVAIIDSLTVRSKYYDIFGEMWKNEE